MRSVGLRSLRRQVKALQEELQVGFDKPRVIITVRREVEPKPAAEEPRHKCSDRCLSIEIIKPARVDGPSGEGRTP